MSSLVLPTVGLKDQLRSLPVFLPGEEQQAEVVLMQRNGFHCDRQEEEEEEASSENSSIGSASSSSSTSARGDEEGEEAESKQKDGTLGSLGALEESLPVKRGLSNFFTGKSKSFASLADVATACARDVAKQENPFNKRRRLLMMSKMRRASYASLLCPPLPSLLSPAHTVEEADDEEEEEDEPQPAAAAPLPPLPHHGSAALARKQTFRSPRSFSLSDLQSHA
ncbi:KID-containing protein 1-like [Curcuma longa]|uniref:KID-containing protein 1-like n=1 Tax=Curcuma longa TaxID=136217 RepID=UPI003D9E8372